MMRLRLFRHVMPWALVAGVLVGAQPSQSWAVGSLTVDAGYDLFASPVGSFPGLGTLVGVPLGTFNFGSGLVPVGNTDTIAQRLTDVTVAAVGNTGTIPLLLRTLQLETTAPVNFGGNGLDNYFMTLQSARGGPATTGLMSITFLSTTNGTFSSFFDVFFDIRKGSLAGPIVFASDLVATNTAAPWGRVPPPGAVTIPGVNFNLDGTDSDKDFWPATAFTYSYPNSAFEVLTNATVPEPSSLILLATGVLTGALGWKRWRKIVA
jgi:hypothetical protein